MEKAWKQWKAADHLVYVTYPLVDDPKLLLGVLHNLYNALEAGMHHRVGKGSFVASVAKLYAREKKEYATFLQEIYDLLELQKNCPVEFERKGKLVFCNKDYEMKVVSLNDIKIWLEKAKLLLKSISEENVDI